MRLVGGQQHRQEGARGVVDPAPADVEGLLPLAPVAGDETAAAADAGVVEQQVDPVGVHVPGDLALEAVHLDLVGDVGDVGGDARPLGAPSASAQAHRLDHVLLRHVAHGHVAAFGDQLARASSRPMPVPPPVMTAILPVKSFMASVSSSS